MTQAAATATRVDNPFPGLRPFEEKDQYLFFGRESQVDTMIDKLAATHFLAVVGGSGSGKSSLVNCGLKPALRRGLMSSAGSTWRMAYMTTLRASKTGLVDSLAQANLAAHTNLLVIADQFEELFRYRNLQPSSEGGPSSEEKSVAFVNLLLEASASSHSRILAHAEVVPGTATHQGLGRTV